MGMFDQIKCVYPLPLPEHQGELAGRNWRENEFQTKDFDCLMDHYCIREDGTLWQQSYAWKTNRSGPPSRAPADCHRLIEYTGTVHFHDWINGNHADYWVEFAAVFVSGKLTELEIQHWEERDNRDRLAQQAKWNAKNLKRERFLATWIGRYLYPPYAWIVHGCLGLPTYRLWQWIGSQCQRIGLWFGRLADWFAPHGDPIRSRHRRRILNDWFVSG
jgi:hypothetical protein